MIRIYHCHQCGFEGEARRIPVGSRALELALWLAPLASYYFLHWPFLLAVALIYTIYRHSTYISACRKCSSENISRVRHPTQGHPA